MLVRITSGLLRSSWWIVLATIVLVAAYLVAGRLIVYGIAHNKESLVTFLHESGLQNVAVKEIESDWRVFDPGFLLNNVVLSRDGEEVLVIERLRLRLSSWRSLFDRTPIVREMEVSGLSFTVIRDDLGFRVKGFPRGDTAFNFKPILDSVPYLDVIRISGVNVAVHGHAYHFNIVSRDAEPWVIRAEGTKKHISFPLYLERDYEDQAPTETRINLVGFYDGDLRSTGFSTELYLDAPQIGLANFLPEVEVSGRQLTRAMLGANVWLMVRPGHVDVTGNVNVTEIGVGSDSGYVQLLEDIGGTFRFRGDSFSSGQLLIPALTVTDGATNFSLDELQLVIGRNAGVTSAGGYIPSLDVETILGLIRLGHDKGLVPERLAGALDAVAPRGLLTEIGFAVTEGMGEARLVARLRDYAMDAYLGVPAIDRLNGLISLEPDRGYLDIDNDEFQLNFNMFPAPWPFDSGRGRVSFELADDRFLVSSGLIELVEGDLSAYGKVVLNLPGDRAHQTWGLTLGVNDAELLEAHKYIPNTISRDLVDWLTSSVLSGSGPASGLTFHGALFRGAPRIRKSHDMFFDVADASLKYHQDWPQMDHVTGGVHVTPHEVTSENVTGGLFATDVVSASLMMPFNREGRADTILIEATGEGPFPDLIRTLNETPLAETTANMAAAWQGEGAMAADLKLNVPIGDRKLAPVDAEVEVRFADATLVMPEFDLKVMALEGKAHYSTTEGLSSPGFVGQSFDKAIRGEISTDVHGEGGEIHVKIKGQIAADALYQWSDQILLSRAAGTIDYEAGVHVPFGGERDETYVTATTDLVGMTLNLPHPLGKPDPATRHDFRYSQYFQEDSYRVRMTLDERIQAALKIESGIAVGGRVHFGPETFGGVGYDRIRMTGRLDELDFEAWMDTTETLGELSDVSLEDAIAEHVDSAELLIDNLSLFNLALPDARVRVVRGDEAWLATLENETLTGDITVKDDDSLPLGIKLSRLNFEGEGEDGDPLGDVDPLSLGDIDFSTEQLILDGEDYGSWSFNYRVEPGLARLDNLTADAVGLTVLPTSSVTWHYQGGEHKTTFNGDIQINDLAHTLTSFGFASSIEGQAIKLKTELDWQGSPASVDVMKVAGSVDIHKGEGRFVQAETGSALKLLGIFDFASLARRFRLDFSDVVDKGFEFDEIAGITTFDSGVVRVTEPIVIRGSSGRFTVGGTVDLNSNTLDNEMIVTLPVGSTLPWYAAYSAIATGPLAGAGVMIAQRVFQNQIDQMSSAKYKITGTMEAPDIEFVAIFDDSVASAGGDAGQEGVAESDPTAEDTEAGSTAQ